ncbi:MAG: hypothetical protein ABI171_08465 [Collimonas sp.]|uniref:hypothetical protein n=1 Tax=Collimonas sp. TaxID=1963772 RepID=UPI003262E7BD
MLKIFETAELMKKLDEIKVAYEKKRYDIVFLGTAEEALKDIEEWKYSTGAIFDQPPHGDEMGGFAGGRLLKKQYPSPYEARLKGAYSSGFINGQHRVTISPSAPVNIPLDVARFRWEDGTLHTEHIKYYNHLGFQSAKAPALTAMSTFYAFDKNIRADVGVGISDAYSIFLYYYNEKNLIETASMVTAPYDFQSEYQMQYDEHDVLVSVMSGDVIVWQAKSR